jgi:hypothetical protein
MVAMASVSLDETLEMSTLPWFTLVIGGRVGVDVITV